jgi:hypothetical protein
MNVIFNKAMLNGRFALLILLLSIYSSANAQTIKLATVAPEGSSWMVAMRAGA